MTVSLCGVDQLWSTPMVATGWDGSTLCCAAGKVVLDSTTCGGILESKSAQILIAGLLISNKRLKGGGYDHGAGASDIKAADGVGWVYRVLSLVTASNDSTLRYCRQLKTLKTRFYCSHRDRARSCSEKLKGVK